MSNDFSHYPDMDHNGSRDLKDCAMFHEMMDEWDAQSGENSGTSRSTSKSPTSRGQAKDDILTTRIAWGICALITGIPGLLLLRADISDSLILSAFALMLLVGFLFSLKGLLFG